MSGHLYTVAVGYQIKALTTLYQPLSTAFTRSHYKVTDDTLESSVADSLIIACLDLYCHSVQMPAHPPLSTLAYAAVASSGTCHCYPEWHNFPVYPTAYEIYCDSILYVLCNCILC